VPRRADAVVDGRPAVTAGRQPEAAARALFAPLGPTYDRYARLLSFGQDPRWRRFLVGRVPAGPGDRVLDVATGTGAVALELVRTRACDVVGLDQSPEMLAVARRRIAAAGAADRVELVQATAAALPFDDAAFDHLTVTYLLRYVAEPAAVLQELARVVRPGGTLAMLEFAVPAQPLPRLGWEAWVRAGLPLSGRLAGPGWAAVGRFLGPSIRDFDRRLPAGGLAELFAQAGVVAVAERRLSLGGGVVVWGRRG
jgi:demethylmenaquinone methyltransferase/2-methoxy-6-polyprenyl-1,4-benzoquinol methylase